MTETIFEASMDVAYPFSDNMKEYSEGKKEKPGMSWKLKLEMPTRKISDTDKSLIPLSYSLNGKYIQ